MMNRFNEEIYSVRDEPLSSRRTRAPLISPKPHPEAIYYPESLSSFLSRAASDLSFTKTELIDNYVLPRTSLDYPCRFLDSGRDAYSCNSTGHVALEVENASQQLFSKFSHHEFSSFAFLEPLLGTKARGVVSGCLRWCPHCLDEWRRNRLEVYYPLYWLAQDAEVCLKHLSRLSAVCPCCTRRPNVITSSSVQGYCDYCGEWLGNSSALDRPSSSSEVWNSHAINLLVQYKYLIQSKDLLSNFRRFVTELAQANGCARHVEKRLGLSESLIKRWRVRNRPKMDRLLDVCQKIDIYPHEIILGGAQAPLLTNKRQQKTIPSRVTKCSKDDLARISGKVRYILYSDSSISFQKICEDLGVTRGFFRYQYPELTRDLSLKSNQRSNINLFYRQSALYGAAISILQMAYFNNKFIGTHQLRELLHEYPGFGHVSMPSIRRFILNSSVNGIPRNLIELLPNITRENLLLHSMKRSNQDDE